MDPRFTVGSTDRQCVALGGIGDAYMRVPAGVAHAINEDGRAVCLAATEGLILWPVLPFESDLRWAERCSACVRAIGVAEG